MSITTSYFAVAKKLNGAKISIARFNRFARKVGIDEILESFAPSSELLMDYKDSRINWPEYVERYTSEQKRHYREKPEDFEDLLHRGEKEDLALLCYEKFEGKKTRCHRMILFDMLKYLAGELGYKPEFIEEEPYKKK